MPPKGIFMKPARFRRNKICQLDHRQNPFSVTIQVVSTAQSTPYQIMYTIDDPRSPDGYWHELEPESSTMMDRVAVIDFPVFAVMLLAAGDDPLMTVLQSGGGA